MSQPPDNFQMNVHQFGQTVTWSILFNISILCAILRHRKASIIIHAILSCMIMLMTYFFILYLLIPFGFNIIIA